jgi:gluconokinase
MPYGKATMPNTDLAAARTPLVLAIDIGSSSVRSLLYDAVGNQVRESECQLEHLLVTDREGASEADPTVLFDLLCQCVDGTLEKASFRSRDIAAVSMSCFWHGLMGISRDGEPTTPVYMWADKRAGAVVSDLTALLPVSEAIAATGCRVHSSYWPAKLRWMQQSRPDLVTATATWLSFSDYVALRLAGSAQTSLSMASGTGLLSLADATWYSPILELVGINASQLPELSDRDIPLPPLLEPFRQRWPALEHCPWFPGIGDGAAANVGAGCVGEDRIALTVGTSGAMRAIVERGSIRSDAPLGQLWVYRLDRNRNVLGGALSNGGNVAQWLADQFGDGSFEELSTEASVLAPDSHGLTILPFLAGERSPSWNDQATGHISGLRLSTTGADIYRATLEATAYRFAAIYDDLRGIVKSDHEIHANGAAVLNSPLWLQILSDVLEHRIDALDAEAEASARGAAICALEAIGALDSIRPQASEVIRSYHPDLEKAVAYRQGRERQRILEDAISSIPVT